MRKYVCSVCGYVYDESKGDPDSNIAAGTKWEDIPDDWACPLCGATKSEFVLQEDTKEPVNKKQGAVETVQKKQDVIDAHDDRELSFGELSVLCSNLAKGCEKQYKPEEAGLFSELSDYYSSKDNSVGDYEIKDLTTLVMGDLESNYPAAKSISTNVGDRGALRAAIWGEKATKILQSLISRYEKQKDELLEGTNVFVCEICGFMYIGDEAPAICPVCKVPSMKIMKIQRGA